MYWIKAIVSWIFFLPIVYFCLAVVWVLLSLAYSLWHLPEDLKDELLRVTNEANRGFFGCIIGKDK